MPKAPRQAAADVAAFVLQQVAAHPTDISAVVARRFRMTRQAAHRHVMRLVAQGLLQVHGRTRGRRYTRGVVVDWHRTYPLTGALQEDVVWRDDIAPLLGGLPPELRAVWGLGLTQVIANAVAHSDGRRLSISVTNQGRGTRALVIDDGVGVFRKLQRSFGLIDERHARLELAKGPITTDPSHHSGIGLAQVALMFDRLQLISGGLTYSTSPTTDVEWISEFDDFSAGTAVVLFLANDSTSRVDDAAPGDHVTVPVRLARYDEPSLVARSEARRLMSGLERHAHVTLDLADVPSIGQPFADEVFRVFALQHPGTHIVAINENDEVRRMRLRVTAADAQR